MIRVLVAEDEEYLVEVITIRLRREAVAVGVVGDRASVLEQMMVGSHDITVLDRDLSVIHGDEVYRRVVHDHPSTQVLMLAASWTLDARVGGLKLEADGYPTKPSEFPEPMVRLRASRRRSRPVRTPVLEAYGVRLGPFRRKAYRDGRFVHLSPKEFAALQVLMETKGGVLGVEAFLEKTWDANADPFTNSTRVTISHLRCKFGEPQVAQTVPDADYGFST